MVNNVKNDISFEKFAELIRQQFSIMCSSGKLFISSVSGDKMWDLYLNSFTSEDNPVFRDPNSSVNNCNRDKHFIRTYGNIVGVGDDNEIVTMFDIYDAEIEDSTYYNSIVVMRDALKQAPIKSVFAIHYDDLVKQPYEKCKKTNDVFQLGYKSTNKQYTKEEVAKFGVVTTDKVYTFHHFFVSLPKQYVLTSGESIGTYYSKVNTSHEIFVKGLSIPLETLQVVSELMAQGSLLRADLYKYKVDEFITIKQEYDNVISNKDNWTWKRFSDISFARFANELIGTTCLDLAQGKDINTVCKEFNIRVDPANYNKAKAPITQSQIDNAAKRIVELGYEDSFKRRFGTIDDININERIHTNISGKNTSKTALFASLKGTNSGTLSRHKKAEFDAIETVSIETFINSILPNSKSIQVFLENSFSNNLVTMTTSIDPETKKIFKWNNNFSWTYNGNLAGKSFIKEVVKDKGGNVSGVLRGSLVWNESGKDNSDLDCWNIFTDRSNHVERIGYSTSYRKRSNGFSSCGGQLDIDIMSPNGKLAAENIYFQNRSKLKKGTYLFYVNPYSRRNSEGFKFEIEVDGETYNYEFNGSVNSDVRIAEVTFDGTSFSIKHLLDPVSSTSANMWGA